MIAYDELKTGDRFEMEADWRRNGYYTWEPGTVKARILAGKPYKVLEPDNDFLSSKLICSHRMEELRLIAKPAAFEAA